MKKFNYLLLLIGFVSLQTSSYAQKAAPKMDKDFQLDYNYDGGQYPLEKDLSISYNKVSFSGSEQGQEFELTLIKEKTHHLKAFYAKLLATEFDKINKEEQGSNEPLDLTPNKATIGLHIRYKGKHYFFTKDSFSSASSEDARRLHALFDLLYTYTDDLRPALKINDGESMKY